MVMDVNDSRVNEYYLVYVGVLNTEVFKIHKYCEADTGLRKYLGTLIWKNALSGQEKEVRSRCAHEKERG